MMRVNLNNSFYVNRNQSKTNTTLNFGTNTSDPTRNILNELLKETEGNTLRNRIVKDMQDILYRPEDLYDVKQGKYIRSQGKEKIKAIISRTEEFVHKSNNGEYQTTNLHAAILNQKHIDEVNAIPYKELTRQVDMRMGEPTALIKEGINMILTAYGKPPVPQEIMDQGLEEVLKYAKKELPEANPDNPRSEIARELLKYLIEESSPESPPKQIH